MTTTEDLGGAYGLLQYDPELVVVGQLHNRDVLDQLSGFASKLTRYVEIAKECQPRDEHNAIDHLAAKVKQEEVETEVEVGPPKANVSDESLEVVASEERYYHKKEENDAPDSESESGADTLTSRREEDAAEPSPKRQRLEFSKTIQPTELSTVMEPPDGYEGTLSESRLKRSVGLTRETLNLHREDLGLTAMFGRGAISKTGDRVSHLTLNPKYEKLPYTSGQKLQMWLAVGPLQRKIAIPLSPDVYPQQPAIPIFWAEPQNGGRGADLCYYVGHFHCVRFEKKDEIIGVVRRQALLEFEFKSFDHKMERELAKIAAQGN